MRKAVTIIALAVLAACQEAPMAGEGAEFQGIVLPTANGEANLYVDGRRVHDGATFPVRGVYRAAEAGMDISIETIGGPSLRVAGTLPAAGPGRADTRSFAVERDTADGRQRYEGQGTIRVTEIELDGVVVPTGEEMLRVRGRYSGAACSDAGRCIDAEGAFAFTVAAP